VSLAFEPVPNGCPLAWKLRPESPIKYLITISYIYSVWRRELINGGIIRIDDLAVAPTEFDASHVATNEVVTTYDLQK
jgi:hypothetical protein